MEQSWEKTKKIYAGGAKMPPLTEAKLKNPSFKTVLEIIKATMQNTTFAKGLFTEEELNYANYPSVDPEIEFMNRLIEFIDLFTDKKCGINASMLIGASKDANKLHKILQKFGKFAKSGKSSAETVKKLPKKKFITVVKVDPKNKLLILREQQ